MKFIQIVVGKGNQDGNTLFGLDDFGSVYEYRWGSRRWELLGDREMTDVRPPNRQKEDHGIKNIAGL